MSDVTIYFDMDGTMCEYEKDYLSRGVYLNAKPHSHVIDAMILLAVRYNVEILTSVPIDDNGEMMKWVIEEKCEWLDKHGLGDVLFNRNFNRGDVSKAKFISDIGNSKVNILIDDYTKNLKEWVDFIGNGNNIFISVKAINNINSTNGSWVGTGRPNFNVNDDLHSIADYISGISDFTYNTNLLKRR